MRLAAALLALIAVASPACAQDDIDEPRAAALGGPVDPLAATVMGDFGRCVVGRNTAASTRIVEMDFRSPDYGATLRRFFKGHSYCLRNGKLRTKSALVVGTMAETLLLKEGLDKLPPRIAAAGPVAPRDDIEATGLCLVRGAPNATATLLSTKMLSKEESEAFRPITPLLSGCIKQGQEARFNRHGLRALIALAAYRTAHTPVATGMVQ